MNDIQKRNQAMVQACNLSGLLDAICTEREARRIRAYYLEGMPMREAAQREGVDVSVVCRSIRRGMERLRRERGDL